MILKRMQFCPPILLAAIGLLQCGITAEGNIGDSVQDCQAGSYQCKGEVLMHCEYGSWKTVEDCGEKGAKCGADSCVYEQATCTDDDLRCNNDVLEVCTNNAWGEKTNCGANNQVCKNNSCVDGQTTCSDDDLRCNNDVLEVCKNNAWEEKTNCGANNQVCKNNSCVDGQTTCSDDELRCTEDVLQRCVNGSWEEKENCEAQGKTCENKNCVDSGSSSDTPVGRHGALHIQGSELVDQNGQPVQLKGMSLFWHNWMGQYYNAAAVNWLVQDWNISIVRAAIAVNVENGYLENEGDAKGKAKTVINAAIDEGIYVIVDWHTHSVDDNRSQSKAFFEEMARDFGDKPNIIYEVFNEPVDQSWSQIKSYAEEIIRAIRVIDPDNIILVGCRSWSQEILEPANDPISGQTNIAYTSHFYAGTHQQWLRDRVKAALDKGIHVFISEWGTSDADGGSNGVVYIDESNRWIDFMAQHKLSWCNWSIADKAEASAALKPSTSGNGGWSDSQLTESGKYVRSKIKE